MIATPAAVTRPGREVCDAGVDRVMVGTLADACAVHYLATASSCHADFARVRLRHSEHRDPDIVEQEQRVGVAAMSGRAGLMSRHCEERSDDAIHELTRRCEDAKRSDFFAPSRLRVNKCRIASLHSQ